LNSKRLLQSQKSKGLILMLKKTFLFVCSFLALVLLAACSEPGSNPKVTASPSPAQGKPVTSLNFVTANIAKVDVASGGSVELVVNVQVQNGYHINANPATDPYLKATEVVPQPADGITVGYVKYPNALKKKFSFSDKELAVYEGEVPIKVMVKADKATAKGPHKLAARLNVQACDDQVCYAPGTLELSLPIVVN
jgi:hypothetical protein